MKRLAFIIATPLTLCALWFAAAVGAEDGDPTPLSKPTPCNYQTLFLNENYGGSNQNDCVTGGSGQNAIGLYGGTDWADGRGGSDSIYGGDQQDVIYGGKEGDHLEGEGGNDFLRAGCPGGCDQSNPAHFGEMLGGSGNDTLAACNNVKDVLKGGAGDFDTAYVDPSKDDWSGFEKVIGC